MRSSEVTNVIDAYDVRTWLDDWPLESSSSCETGRESCENYDRIRAPVKVEQPSNAW